MTADSQSVHPDFKQFLKRLLIFTGILGLGVTILYFFLPSKFFTPVLPFLFCFFLSVTILNYFLLSRAARKKLIRFINYYLLSTVIRLLLYIAVLIVYILLNRSDALPFGIWFFLLYLFYTVYEVTALVNYSKSLHQ